MLKKKTSPNRSPIYNTKRFLRDFFYQVAETNKAGYRKVKFETTHSLTDTLYSTLL